MESSVETLEKGQTLLVSIRKVNSSDSNFPKIQMEIAEFIEKPEGDNLLALLNADDDRFTAQKPRRAWMTVSPKMFEKYFNIKVDVNDMNIDEVIDINKLNPEIMGKRLHIEVTETVTPDEYQTKNTSKAAKRKGADGEFITHQGHHIFSNTEVVLREPNHTFLEADKAITVGQSAAVSSGSIGD